MTADAHALGSDRLSAPGPTGGWLVIAATSFGSARRFAAERRIEAAEIVTRRELRHDPGAIRKLVRDRGIKRAVAHSVDWSHQPLPQLFEVALLLAPVDERYIADDHAGTIKRVDRAAGRRLWARLPADVADGGRAAAAETLRFAARRSGLRTVGARIRHGDRSAGASRNATVMAMLVGSMDTPVGGSITHMSGMLAGFKELGLRVGLLTTVDPPEQLARVIDDLEIARPLSRGQRAVKDVSMLSENAIVREAGRALAARLRPTFMYQRHRAFLFAGIELASASGLPLTLEWNGSEAWIRANWEEPVRPLRALDPLLASIERQVVRSASWTLAISSHARDMALAAGADPANVLLVPNAASTAEIGTLIRNVKPRGARRPLIGWVGSFGRWHGPELLVEAIAELDGVDLLMIGDGPYHASCQRLAASLGLDGQVEWAGSLPHDEAVQRLAGCDLLVSPHIPLDGQQPFFGSPTKLFEYMAIGRPIVASDLGQIGEVLEDHRTALLAEPGNVSALSSRIAEALAMPDRGAALGDAAQREAAGRHDWVHRAGAVLDAMRTAGGATP